MYNLDTFDGRVLLPVFFIPNFLEQVRSLSFECPSYHSPFSDFSYHSGAPRFFPCPSQLRRMILLYKDQLDASCLHFP